VKAKAAGKELSDETLDKLARGDIGFNSPF
jgi:hypothetical protein